MKFYDSVGPNPRAVRMFAAERGASLGEVVKIDIRAGDNRKPDWYAKNPSGQLPALELDNGVVLAEITAICEYLDETGPAGKTLIGSTAQERAETRMWARRVDLHIIEPMGWGFRSSEGYKMFSPRMRLVPQAADDFKLMTQEKLGWLNGLMEGKEFLCGKRLTMGDITLFAFLDFGSSVKQPIDPKLTNMVAFYERMKARPSASA